MAMFKLNPMYSGDTQLVCVAGSYVFQNTTAAPQNTVVPTILFKANANVNGAAIGQNETVAPQGTKIPCVLNPTPAYAPQVATGANANVAMLDLRAYPGDIVSVQVNAAAAPSATAGALSLISVECTCVGIDQTNNFVYVLCTGGSGSAQPWQNNMSLHFAVYFKDTYVP